MKLTLKQPQDLIYPFPESDVVVEPFEISPWWPRAYAMDVYWNQTTALWGTWDRDSDVIYLYSEHYIGQAHPSIHADGIKARGEWMWGVMDPASSGSNQKDSTQVIKAYGRLGLNLVAVDDAVEAGIQAVYERLSTERLKVFRTLSAWRSAFRIYRRGDKGKVMKETDHLMACTRCLIFTGMKYADIDHDQDDEY